MNCSTHTSEPIKGTCSRCGNFVCALDSKETNGQLHCLECAARLTDHLTALKDELWGRRDGWAWLMGLGAVFDVFILFSLFLGSVRTGFNPTILLSVALVAIATANSVAYFFGQPIARTGIIVLPLVFLVLTALDPKNQDPTLLLPLVLAAFIGFAIYRDPRNKLFFKIDPGPAALEKLWQRHRNNQLAQTGLYASILGLLVPGISLLSLICCLIGLSRVNPDATPPIGRKGMAIAGTVISVLGIVEWVLIIFVLPHR